MSSVVKDLVTVLNPNFFSVCCPIAALMLGIPGIAANISARASFFGRAVTPISEF